MPISNIEVPMLQEQRSGPPLIAIVGTTGSKKSELALQLAKRIGAHIINSDALQVYSDLSIITNKVTREEQESVPHHLLDLLSFSENPAGPPYSVRHFDKDATAIINKYHNQNIPVIIAGGTHYYVQYLLWGYENATEGEPKPVNPEIKNLDAATLYAELVKVDPEAAARWHPNDIRRVRRSLELYYERDCKPLTDVPAPAAPELRYPTLVLWTHTDPAILKDRLDSRVDIMVKLGLFRELWTVWQAYARVPELLRDKGAFQAIGFRQFLPYLDAVDEMVVKSQTSVGVLLESSKDMVVTDQTPDPVLNQFKLHVQEIMSGGDAPDIGQEDAFSKLDQLRIKGLTAMKLATVQYARRQIRWIRSRMVPRIVRAPSDSGNVPAVIYKINTSDKMTSESFAREIVDPLEPIVRQFLSDNLYSKGLDSLLPPLADKIVQINALDEQHEQSKSPIDLECQICQRSFRNQNDMTGHLNSRGHRRLLKIRKKEEKNNVVTCSESNLDTI